MEFTKQQKIIIGAAGAVILVFILILIGVIPGLRRSSQTTTLSFWGVDDPSLWAGTIKNFEAANSQIKVSYTQVNPADYETNLINALAAGQGPDVLMFKNNWLTKRVSIISPLSPSSLSVASFGSLFPQAAQNDFVSGGQIYALPLTLDTLALAYNQNLFNQAGIALPPKTWSEFEADSLKLTQFKSGKIVQSGTALGGTSASVGNASEILSLLMLELQTPMVSQNSGVSQAVFNTQSGQTALDFYTQFGDPKSRYYAWNDSLGNSIDDFTGGKVGMILAHASDLQAIKSANPYLNIGVASAPQFNLTQAVNFPSYWGLAVSKRSVVQPAAWSFALYAATDQASAKNYALSTGESPALRTLIAEAETNPQFSVFAYQALTARDWPNPDPEAVSGIFDTMIKSVTSHSTDSYTALSQAAQDITALFQNQ